MPTDKWRKENPEKLRKYRRDWYHRNREVEIIRIKKRKEKVRLWLVEYKKGLKCSNCKENHPACLTFHHKDPISKESNISYSVHNGHGLYSIKKEISKCEVLCENCHRKLHWDLKDKL